MTEKIVNLRIDKLSWRTLLHQVLEREGVEAVVLVVRINDCWETAWSAESTGGIAMATLKLQYDVMREMQEE